MKWGLSGPSFFPALEMLFRGQDIPGFRGIPWRAGGIQEA